MNTPKLTIYLIAVLFACACAKENVNEYSGAQELCSVSPSVEGGETKAVSYKTLGRASFVEQDTIMITTLRRTEYPYEAYTGGIPFALDGGVWKRTNSVPERIYWADAKSNHTIIAYSKPNKSIYRDKFKQVGSVYYSALADPTKAAAIDTIDFTPGDESLKSEDLLTFYSTEVQPNINALLPFKHSLAQVKVSLNIAHFTTPESATIEDVKGVTLTIRDMPCIYKWDQSGAGVKNTDSSDAAAIESLWPGTPYNMVKDIKLWIPVPEGEGSGVNKVFNFYGLAVPCSMDEIEVDFKVQYHDPHTISKKLVKPFKATVKNATAGGKVYFKAGMCTNINISLSHKEGEMVVGVNCSDWISAQDESGSSLEKYSLLLETTDTTGISTEKAVLHGGATAIDKSVWLYMKEDGGVKKIYDIFGHSGDTMNDAYSIKSSEQFLAFGYEMQKGFDFSGKFVSLDTDLVLQPQINASSLSWNDVNKGATCNFNGYFLANGHGVSRLKGAPLFNRLGANAVVESFTIQTIGTMPELSDIGVLASSNEGVVFACMIKGDVEGKVNTGGLVGANSGVIVACGHIGKTTCLQSAGGITGNQSDVAGTETAVSFQAGLVSGGTSMQAAIASSPTATGPVNVFGCFYDNTIFAGDSKDTAVGKSTAEMQKKALVGSADLSNESPDNLNGCLHLWVKNCTNPLITEDLKTRINTHYFEYSVADYPCIK